MGTDVASRAVSSVMARFWLPEVLVLGLLTASCTGPTDTTSPTQTAPSVRPSPSLQPVTDYTSFTDGAAAAGLTISAKGGTGLEDIFGVGGRTVSLDGVRVLAFEYPTSSAANKLRASVSKDAEMVGPAIIDWSNPHLYRSGRLIAVYLGDHQGTLRTLQHLLGPQFAGW